MVISFGLMRLEQWFGFLLQAFNSYAPLVQWDLCHLRIRRRQFNLNRFAMGADGSPQQYAYVIFLLFYHS